MSETTTTTVTLTWTASTDNIEVSAYAVYQNNVLLGYVTTPTTQIPNLTPNTIYNYYIIAQDAAGNLSAGSNKVSATTKANLSYCVPSASTAYEYISAVGITKTNNYDILNFGNKDDKGYGNYKDKGITLERGQSYFVTIGKSNATVSNYYNNAGAWIDFNGDGVFSTNESIGLVKKSSDTIINLPKFTVPSNASNSQVVMRVAIRSNGDLSACGEANINGEYEDYTISFVNSNSVTNLATDNISDSKITVYPNPVDNELFVKGIKSKANYKLFNLNGSVLNAGEIVNGRSINVKQLPKGVYILELNENGKVTTEKIIKK